MARKTAYGLVPFGDCLTGRHQQCKVEVESMGKKIRCICKCENHGVGRVPPPPPSDLLLEMLAKWAPE